MYGPSLSLGSMAPGLTLIIAGLADLQLYLRTIRTSACLSQTIPPEKDLRWNVAVPGTPLRHAFDQFFRDNGADITRIDPPERLRVQRLD